MEIEEEAQEEAEAEEEEERRGLSDKSLKSSSENQKSLSLFKEN